MLTRPRFVLNVGLNLSLVFKDSKVQAVSQYHFSYYRTSLIETASWSLYSPCKQETSPPCSMMETNKYRYGLKISNEKTQK